MAPAASEERAITRAIQWLHGLWEYYREYSHTALHAASVAALTIFGMLIFIDPIFAVLAVGAYVCPPIALYVLDAEGRTDPEQTDRITDQTGSDRNSASRSDTDSDSDDGDSDSDSDDGDTDSDSNDGDSDSDSDGSDADTDSDTDG